MEGLYQLKSYFETYLNHVIRKQKKLIGEAPLIADPSPAHSPLVTVGWFAKTEIHVLSVEPICPVRQNHSNF